MSSVGGQRQTLRQAVKHVHSLGGTRAYYRGLGVSRENDPQRGRGLTAWDIDWVDWSVPVLGDRHEHVRGVEAGVPTVNGAGRTWRPCRTRFWKHLWECWCDERVPVEPGSDKATSIRIPCPPATLYGFMGRSITDVQAERGPRILHRFGADAGKGDPRRFDILHGL